jgi:two-component system invasion response regulator UvrY
MIKLLIVDDHAVIREGLKKILGLVNDFQIVGAVCDAQEALNFISSTEIDVVLLDITMPGRSGLDIIHDIKLLQPELNIIILSMHREQQFVVKAIKSGASGYLTKELVSQEIIKAIQQVYLGGIYIYPGFNEKLLQH